MKEEAQILNADIKATVNNSERENYWEELLKDRFEEHKVEEFNAMGKGKRSRKQVNIELHCSELDLICLCFMSTFFLDSLALRCSFVYCQQPQHPAHSLQDLYDYV